MKIVCIGRNFSEHAKELKNEIPTEPVIFMKPETALTKGNSVSFSEILGEIHHEIEIVLRISKTAKNISADNAINFIDGIGLGIDFTARDLQTELKTNGLPWEKAKGFDDSAFVSDFFPVSNFELDNLDLELKINDKTVQKSNSSFMLFPIPILLSEISKYFTLNEDDLVFTGTPAGVGKVVSSDVLSGFLDHKQVFELTIN